MSARTAILASCLALALAPVSAAAQDGPAGSVQAHLLASPQEDFGGAVGADLWYPIGIFRVGGFLGVAGVPSAADVYNRVFMTFGPTAAVEVLGDPVGFSIRARGGLWGGATQEIKLTAGGFVGGGAYLLFRLAAGVSLGVGLEVWGLFGDGETALFAPGLGLSWSPPERAE